MDPQALALLALGLAVIAARWLGRPRMDTSKISDGIIDVAITLTGNEISITKVRVRLARLILQYDGDLAKAATTLTQEMYAEADRLGWPQHTKDGIARVVDGVVAELLAEAIDRAIARTQGAGTR